MVENLDRAIAADDLIARAFIGAAHDKGIVAAFAIDRVGPFAARQRIVTALAVEIGVPGHVGHVEIEVGDIDARVGCAVLGMFNHDLRHRAGDRDLQVVRIRIRAEIAHVGPRLIGTGHGIGVRQAHARTAGQRDFDRVAIGIPGLDRDDPVGVQVIDVEVDIGDGLREFPLEIAFVAVALGLGLQSRIAVDRLTAGVDPAGVQIGVVVDFGFVTAGVLDPGIGHIYRAGVLGDRAVGLALGHGLPVEAFARTVVGTAGIHVAVVAIDQVGTCAALDGIVAHVAIDRVVARAAQKRIVAGHVIAATNPAGVFQRVEIDVGDVDFRGVVAVLHMGDLQLRHRTGDVHQHRMCRAVIGGQVAARMGHDFLAADPVGVGQGQMGAPFRLHVDFGQDAIGADGLDDDLGIRVDVIDPKRHIPNRGAEVPGIGRAFARAVQMRRHRGRLVRLGPARVDRMHLLGVGFEPGFRRLVRRHDREVHIHRPGVLREPARDVVLVVDTARSVRIRGLVPFKAFPLARAAGRAGTGRRAIVAKDQVIALPAFDGIVAFVAVKNVVPFVALDGVVLFVAKDRVITRTAFQAVRTGHTGVQTVEPAFMVVDLGHLARAIGPQFDLRGGVNVQVQRIGIGLGVHLAFEQDLAVFGGDLHLRAQMRIIEDQAFQQDGFVQLEGQLLVPGMFVGQLVKAQMAPVEPFAAIARGIDQVFAVVGFGDGGSPGRAIAGFVTINHIVALAAVDRVTGPATIDFVIALTGMHHVCAVTGDHDVVVAHFSGKQRVIAVDLVAVAVGVTRADRVRAIGAFNISVGHRGRRGRGRGRPSGPVRVVIVLKPVPEKEPSHSLTLRDHRDQTDPSGVAAGARAATPSSKSIVLYPWVVPGSPAPDTWSFCLVASRLAE